MPMMPIGDLQTMSRDRFPAGQVIVRRDGPSTDREGRVADPVDGTGRGGVERWLVRGRTGRLDGSAAAVAVHPRPPRLAFGDEPGRCRTMRSRCRNIDVRARGPGRAWRPSDGTPVSGNYSRGLTLTILTDRTKMTNMTSSR